MLSLVLVGRPQSLHIMVQALGVRWTRETRWSYLAIETDLSPLVGGRASRWIEQRRIPHDIRLVRTRNYIPRQTAFYAEWLVFRQKELATEFLENFPRFHIQKRMARLHQDRQVVGEDMERRLKRGGFEIGKHPADQRRAIAQRYIDLDDRLRDIDDHCHQLDHAAQRRGEWTSALAGGWQTKLLSDEAVGSRQEAGNRV